MATHPSPTYIPNGFPHFSDEVARDIIEENYVSAARGHAGTGRMMLTARLALDLLGDKTRFRAMHTALQTEIDRPLWQVFGRKARLRAIMAGYPHTPPWRGSDLSYLDDRITLRKDEADN